MIDKQKLAEAVDRAIAGTDIFVVDIKVSADNTIVVELDSRDGLDIDTCARITRDIEAEFDRDAEDYSLEVGSAGLTAPFKVRGQYEKNLGNDVEVLTTTGRKFHGVLTEVADDTFTVTTQEKQKVEGKKKPVMVDVPVTVPYAEAKKVNYLIRF